jgi:hypothetical protein
MYCPYWQVVQELAPKPEDNPVGQLLQVSLEVAFTAVEKVPAGHTEQKAETLEE